MSTFSALCLTFWAASFILVGVRGETVSLGSGVPCTPWGAGATKEKTIVGDAKS